jgi:hypothetical protein
MWYTVHVIFLYATKEFRSLIAWCFQLTAQKSLFWMNDGDDNDNEEVEVGERENN